jgi:hypothetical protein
LSLLEATISHLLGENEENQEKSENCSCSLRDVNRILPDNNIRGLKIFAVITVGTNQYQARGLPFYSTNFIGKSHSENAMAGFNPQA